MKDLTEQLHGLGVALGLEVFLEQVPGLPRLTGR